MITIAWHLGVIFGCLAACWTYTENAIRADKPTFTSIGNLIVGVVALAVSVYLSVVLVLGMW